MDVLEKMYQRRFNGDFKVRDKMYNILCGEYLQKYIPKGAVVLDIASGYCEFINNIKAGRKIVLDLNTETKEFAGDGVEVIISSSTEMVQVEDESVDVVFTSNFFEHLSKQDIVRTINEVRRVLKKDGKLFILQPNIRYCYKDYWNFYDHITPLDDRSLCEVLEINGFDVVECKPRFLPYSTKSKYPRSVVVLKIFLKVSIMQRILGKQVFIYAKKKRSI